MESLDLILFNPELNPEIEESIWLDRAGSPKKMIQNDELPRTIDYEILIKQWRKAK